MFVFLYRLIAELQQPVSQPGGIPNEFLQRLFETDGFLKNLIAAVHPHGVRRLGEKKNHTPLKMHVGCYF